MKMRYYHLSKLFMICFSASTLLHADLTINPTPPILFPYPPSNAAPSEPPASAPNNQLSPEAPQSTATPQNPQQMQNYLQTLIESLPPAPPSPPTGTTKLAELVLNNPMLSTLLVATRKANFGPLLLQEGPYTFFAPDNAAFKRLLPGTLRFLFGLNNRERLIAILANHVVPGQLMASDLQDGMTLMTLEGDILYVTVIASEIYVNNAKLIRTNILGSNGVMHIINRLLMP